VDSSWSEASEQRWVVGVAVPLKRKILIKFLMRRTTNSLGRMGTLVTKEISGRQEINLRGLVKLRRFSPFKLHSCPWRR
jgi:hypothetical protein